MNAKLLIDAIVHQTTVLIAQLSTAAGIRAPLAHIADQVFVELSREIEAQGVSRKVAADMFGLAIRSYQKKVQRLTESTTERGHTLWQAVLGALESSGSLTRREILERFSRDDAIVVGSVLNDLVSSGLVYRTGSGDGSVFGVSKESDRARAVAERKHESLAPIVWAVIYQSGGILRSGLRGRLDVDDGTLDEALATLEREGRIRRAGEVEDPLFSASTLVVPVNAEHGWEAAVFDHFQAVVRAIGTKVRRGQTRSSHEDVIGGATLTFQVHPDHPHYDETLGLLRRVRAEVNELWNRVEDHNQAHPIGDDEGTLVSFYFGQSVASEGES